MMEYDRFAFKEVKGPKCIGEESYEDDLMPQTIRVTVCRPVVKYNTHEFAGKNWVFYSCQNITSQKYLITKSIFSMQFLTSYLEQITLKL